MEVDRRMKMDEEDRDKWRRMEMDEEDGGEDEDDGDEWRRMEMDEEDGDGWFRRLRLDE